MTAPRRTIERFTLDPATGRAIAVKRGEVLIVEQIGDGQCLDFNAYNLHDYKEQFHSGRTRGLHGLHPSVGDHLWSAPPRERVMFTIVEDTVGDNDLTYSRCSAFLYEAHYGFAGPTAHSNCHDIFAEAIREWELTPDDVHDSFNGFMNTRIVDGRLAIAPMRARKGDRLAFLARMDTLAVVVCCGGDLGATNNYELKGLAIEIAVANDADQSFIADARFAHQRDVASFRQPTIKADRALRKIDAFTPRWPWREAIASRHVIDVALTEAQSAMLDRLADDERFRDFDRANLLRFVFFQWLERHHRVPIKQALRNRSAKN